MRNELRTDYFLDRQVIISVGRGKRPSDFMGKPPEPSAPRACFFCPGNEGTTPPEISRVEEDGKWVIRVFPNKFPAVTEEEGADDGRVMPAYGRHEVVVETPDHDKSLADLTVERIARVLGVYSQRIEALQSGARAEYVLVFKNHGRSAGASLEHTHTQIISLPVVPRLIREEVYAADKYSQEKGSCPLCDAWMSESQGDRSVWDDGNVCAFAPFASRSPFEVWIVPKRHVRSLKELDGQELSSMAGALKAVLSRLKEGLNDPHYNLYVHISPAGEDLHLHVEVLPRLSIWAGFELGSEIVINTMPPEAAADFYRGHTGL